jgi:hypothetical protein
MYVRGYLQGSENGRVVTIAYISVNIRLTRGMGIIHQISATSVERNLVNDPHCHR